MIPSEHDLAMMRRCLALSEAVVGQGELPFAALVCRGEDVIAEASNRVVRDGDATQHAELLAVSQAQRRLGRRLLDDCTLYSSVEPCAMCAFPIRETGIARVVFALGSPMMGGYSRWNVLGDHEMSNLMPQVFRGVPEVVGGVLQHEAAEVWRRWNPLIWEMIRLRGCLQELPAGAGGRRVQPAERPAGILRGLIAARPSLGAIWHAVRLAFGQGIAGKKPATDR
jgi:tRNA(adenine34) deaminase